jgi:hypothetical protein
MPAIKLPHAVRAEVATMNKVTWRSLARTSENGLTGWRDIGPLDSGNPVLPRVWGVAGRPAGESGPYRREAVRGQPVTDA